MAITKNEILHSLWEKVLRLVVVQDEFCETLTFTETNLTKFASNEVSDQLLKIQVHAVYSTKNDSLDSIVKNLRSIKQTVGATMCNGMELLGYTYNSHNITPDMLTDQFNEFCNSADYDFSTPIFTFSITKREFNKALAVCKTELKADKKILPIMILSHLKMLRYWEVSTW